MNRSQTLLPLVSLCSSLFALSSTALAQESATATPSDELRVDPMLILQAEEVWKIVANPDNPVWPGWDATSTPILFYLPGVQDLLINHPDAPEGFVPYTGPVRFDGATMHVRNGETHFDADGQNTSTDLGEARTLVVADTLSNRKMNVLGLVFDPRKPAEKAETFEYSSIQANPYGQMKTIAHEAFHVYQDLFSEGKHANEATVAQYPTLSVKNNVGFSLESQWLAKALRTSSEAELRNAALNWLAIRTDRRASLPDAAAAYEDGNEFAEGVAMYIEYRLMNVLEGTAANDDMYYAQGFYGYGDLQPQRDAMIDRMVGTMSGEIGVNNDLYGTAPIRMRLYSSGMAIGALLDRLMPGREGEWKKQIFEQGTTLTSVATAALKADQSDLARRMKAIETGDKYASLVSAKAELRDAGQKHIAEMIQSIEEGEGTLLTIDYSAVADAQVRLGFTPFGVQRIDEGRAIYHMVPISGRVRPETVFYQSAPSSLLDDRGNKHISFRLPQVTTREEVLKALGLASWPDGVVTIAQCELPGVSLQLGKTQLTWEAGRLNVNLR